MSNKKRRTDPSIKKMVVSAVLSALGVAIMYLGSVVDVLDLTLDAAASMIIIFAFIEIGTKYAWLIYGVTAVLTLLLLPAKLPGLMYLLFIGYYPILKASFERLHFVISWILKLSLFNTAFLLIILAVNYLFKIPDTGFDFTPLLIIFGNITFVLYDFASSTIITLYLVKLRRRLGLKNYFEN